MTWAEIAGADSNSYTWVDGNVGSYLRVAASYTDGEGSCKSAQAVFGECCAGAYRPCADSSLPLRPAPEPWLRIRHPERNRRAVQTCKGRSNNGPARRAEQEQQQTLRLF